MTGRRIALLSQKRFFEQWQRRLPSKIETQVGKILAKDSTTDDEVIENAIAASFELHPLDIGEIESIAIEVNERGFMNEYRVIQSGYHIEANLTYRGSPELWGALPKKGFHWGMVGIVEHGFVRMQMVIDDRSFDAALHYMTEELEIAREGLAWMMPTVVLLNVQIEDSIRVLARRYTERLKAEED